MENSAVSYDVPTVNDFKSAYFEFDQQTDQQIQSVLSLASLFVDTTWAESDYAPAILALAAHHLKMRKDSGALSSNGQGQVDMSAVQSVQIGNRKISYGSGTRQAVSGGISSASSPTDVQLLLRTLYGQTFLQLRNRNVVGAMVLDGSVQGI